MTSIDSGRRQARGDETRQAILNAARDVFIREGYGGASIRKVARAAGYAHGTIYLHFRDKDDLLYQLCEEQFRVLLERLRAAPRSLGPVERLAAALRAYIAYGYEYPEHYHLLFALRLPHQAHGAHGDERRFGPMAEQVYGFVYDALLIARRKGALAVEDPERDTAALIAAAHGAIELRKSGALNGDEAMDCAERVIALLLRGMAPRSPRDTRDANT